MASRGLSFRRQFVAAEVRETPVPSSVPMADDPGTRRDALPLPHKKHGHNGRLIHLGTVKVNRTIRQATYSALRHFLPKLSGRNVLRFLCSGCKIDTF